MYLHGFRAFLSLGDFKFLAYLCMSSIKKYNSMKRQTIHINGILDEWGYTRSNVQYLLNKHRDSAILCIVNSFGGSVNEGIAISKLFEEHGDVTVRFVGCCASSATWMAFGAKEVETTEDSFWLCHQCSNLINIYKSMKIDDLDKTIQQLENTKKSQEAINLVIAKKYADRCKDKGKSLEDVLQLMGEERWMTASEALEWGFVDKVLPGINKLTDEAKNLIALNCATMNLPIPVFAPSDDVETGLAGKIVDALKGIFANNAPAAPGAETVEQDSPAQSTNNTNTNMKKVILNVAALLTVLNLKELEAADEQVTLTTDQISSINAALEEANKDRESLREVNEVLDAVSDNIKSIDGAKNKALALSNIMSMLPAGAPAGNLVPGISSQKHEQLGNVAKDGINEEMRNYYNARNRK